VQEHKQHRVPDVSACVGGKQRDKDGKRERARGGTSITSSVPGVKTLMIQLHMVFF